MKVIYDYITGTCTMAEVHESQLYDSVVTYDPTTRELRVRRDKIGLQTIYYAQLTTSIVFATELKEILSYLPKPQIRAHELAQPIRHNFPIDKQHTWIEQIKRLRAGEEAIVDKDGLRLHTYWKRDHTPSFTGTKKEAIAETLRLMRQSVRKCIETADGPVAVLLSGGIDSTSLASFAKEIQQDVHVICAGYSGNKYTQSDEREAARQFAQDKGLIYHEVELTIEDFHQALEQLVSFLDEPCFDVSCMAQFALYKKAAEMGFKVILSGLGGDEQFYSYVYHHKVVEALQLRKKFIDLYPIRENWRAYFTFMLKNWKFVLLPNHPVLLDESVPLAWTYRDYCQFAKDATLDYGDEHIEFKDIDVHHSFPQHTDINVMYDFMFSTFANQLCVYLGNKLGSANGVKLRYPLLDADLVEFLDTLPLSMKFDPKRPKQFQKDVMAGIVPDYILYARKRGFEPPFEFIWKMCREYTYKHIHSTHVFFNSMLADRIIDNCLKS